MIEKPNVLIIGPDSELTAEFLTDIFGNVATIQSTPFSKRAAQIIEAGGIDAAIVKCCFNGTGDDHAMNDLVQSKIAGEMLYGRIYTATICGVNIKRTGTGGLFRIFSFSTTLPAELRTGFQQLLNKLNAPGLT